MNLKDIHREKTLFSTQDGCKLSIFHYSYSGETGALEADSGRRVIDSFSLEDICTAVVQSSSAGDGEPFPSEQLSFAELRRRECFVQLTGWQSWSAGWELAPGERLPSYIPVIPPLENYIYPPLVPSREKTRTGSFIMWLRFGTEYLGFASIGRDTAPVNYTFDPKSLSVVITIYSYGKKWKPGEQMAEIALFHARSPFELKGIMGELYGTAHGDRRAQRFAGLEFLSAEEERIIPAGWESWYSHYHNIDETLILRELYALNKNGNLLNQRYIQKGKPIIFQIDDGWQREVGDWEQERLRFPSGLEAVTAKIEGEGYIPGLWIAPFAVSRRAPIFSRKPEWLLRNTKGKPVKAGFNPPWGGDYFCLDLSRDDVIEHIDTVMERVINEWGFRYIKLDFLFAGMLPGAFTVPGGVWEWYIRAVQMLTARKTDRRGKPVAYLGCGLPLELSYRYLPLSRIGADTREHWERGELKLLRFAGRPSAYISMRDTIGRSFMDQTIFVNDPDAVFLRSTNTTLTEQEKELVCLTGFLFGSQILIADDPSAFNEETEGAFTARISALYDLFKGEEFAAVTEEKNIYRIYTRSGKFTGVINLSERSWKTAAADFTGEAACTSANTLEGTPIVSHCRRKGDYLSFDRHSISIYEQKQG